ncbi:hypothetical protein F4604DRAFT_1741866 [Suillus subluteus]|nr:hypothetical protein F4604DRAFT_1741866 [Suillus subluteus]
MLVAGLVSGSLSVAPLLSILTVIIKILYNDLSRPMILSHPESTYSEGMASFIACFVCKYRQSRELLPRNQRFVLTYGRRRPHLSLHLIAYISIYTVVY